MHYMSVLMKLPQHPFIAQQKTLTATPPYCNTSLLKHPLSQQILTATPLYCTGGNLPKPSQN